jgi:branched-chain amino acid transport system permease protein
MEKLKKRGLRASARRTLTAYALVIVAFAILQLMRAAGAVSSILQGMLVPICAYVVMALSLNLTVGILGELSLGHAGFMSMGAFTGTTAAFALAQAIPSAPLRLAAAMAVGAAFAAAAGDCSSAFRCCGSRATTWPSSPWPSARSSRAFSTTSTWGWTAPACT